MDMVTSNQLGKITNAQFEELQTQITQKGTTARINSAAKLRKKLGIIATPEKLLPSPLNLCSLYKELHNKTFRSTKTFRYHTFSTSSTKNFPNETLYHPELYGLRLFEQVLAENLLAGLVKFTNANGILSKLFKHRAMELQATSWMPQYSLKFLIKLLVNSVNCFLAGTTCALKLCNLSLGAGNSIAVLDVLGFEYYLSIAKFLKKYGVVFWKKLDPRDLVPVWFASLVKFIVEDGLLNSIMLSPHSILTNSPCDFGYVSEHLLNSRLGSITVYTDGSLMDSKGKQYCMVMEINKEGITIREQIE
ncbi:hypothetical protein G9A89_007003 [Geosiphon pyriformis]|nr:hypothetical protein G9A89_007003 [Geosiphon pyriformis]